MRSVYSLQFLEKFNRNPYFHFVRIEHITKVIRSPELRCAVVAFYLILQPRTVTVGEKEKIATPR